MSDIDTFLSIIGASGSSGSSGTNIGSLIGGLGGLGEGSTAGGGIAAYDQILGALSNVLGGIASYYDTKQQDEYEAKKLAWQREAERIARENQMRQERVKRRNEIINQMGGGWQSRSPQLERMTWKQPEYRPDPTAEYLRQGQQLIGAVRQFTGSPQSQQGATDIDEATKMMQQMQIPRLPVDDTLPEVNYRSYGYMPEYRSYGYMG